MKLKRMVLAALALALCGATAAQAGQKIMASPPISNDIPVAGYLWCDIVNLNKTDKTITIDIMDINGAVVAGPFTQLLIPNQGTAFSAFGGAAWCRFTVDGSTKKYRALASYDNGTIYGATIPAY